MHFCLKNPLVFLNRSPNIRHFTAVCFTDKSATTAFLAEMFDEAYFWNLDTHWISASLHAKEAVQAVSSYSLEDPSGIY